MTFPTDREVREVKRDLRRARDAALQARKGDELDEREIKGLYAEGVEIAPLNAEQARLYVQELTFFT